MRFKLRHIFNSFIFSIVFLFLSLFTSPHVLAQSAAFSLESSTTNPQPNQSFLVQVFIDTFQASVNTVHLAIDYPLADLALEDISFTNSVFPNIVEKDASSPGSISLTAFTTSFYADKRGLVTTLKFKALKTGESEIKILPASTIHLNDGLGTEVFDYLSSQKSLFISSGLSQAPEPESQTSPPESIPSPQSPQGSFITALAQKILSPFKKKEEITKAADQIIEEAVFFPEQNVIDYTKNPQVKVKKYLNQFKTAPKTQKALYLVILFLFFVTILIIGHKVCNKKGKKLLCKPYKLLKDNKKISSLILVLALASIPLLLYAFKQSKGYVSKAASSEAVFSLFPNNNTNFSAITLRKNEKIKIDVLLNPQEGGSPAQISGVEFKITFDPSKIDIVDKNGNSASQVQTGNIFEGKGLFVSKNTVSNGEIYLSMLLTNGVFSGPTDTVASFYIKSLTNKGSDSLSFVPVVQDSSGDFMHAYQLVEGDPPYSDVLSAAKMNGSLSSSLAINFASATSTPILSLTADNTNLNINDLFDVKIKIDTDGEDIIGVDAVLEYDSNNLLIVDPGINPGSIFSSYSDLTIPDQNGIVNFELSGWSLPDSSPPPPYNSQTNSDNVFAAIKFKALNQGTAQIKLVFDGLQQSTTDSNMLSYFKPGSQKNASDDILASVNNLSLNITAASPSPSPSPSPSSSPSPSPSPSSSPSPSPSPGTARCKKYPADINEDDIVDAFDVSIIAAGWKHKFKNLPKKTCSSDLNGDGEVNVGDIQILVSWWKIPYPKQK